MNLSISTTCHPTRNPYRSRTFTVTFFGNPIHTVVTATPAVAREWVYSLRRNYRHDLSDGDLVVGLGVQWRPTFSFAVSAVAATLQLCVESNCLIFQLIHADAVPATLRRLLADDRVTFVGVHNGRDRKVLEDSWHGGLEVGPGLVDLAQEWGGNWSMEMMAGYFLGYDIVKPRWLGLSDWDVVFLINEQVQYACVDAHLSYLLADEVLGNYYDDDDYDGDHDDDDDDYDGEDVEDDDDDGEDDDGYDGDCGFFFNDDDFYVQSF